MRDLTRLPKVHLHVHLESTIRWPTLRELADANGVAVPDRPASPPVFAGFRAFAISTRPLRPAGGMGGAHPQPTTP